MDKTSDKNAVYSPETIAQMKSQHILNTMMKLDELARNLWKRSGSHKDEEITIPVNAPEERLKNQTWRNYLPHEYWDLEAEAKKRGII